MLGRPATRINRAPPPPCCGRSKTPPLPTTRAKPSLRDQDKDKDIKPISQLSENQQ